MSDTTSTNSTTSGSAVSRELDSSSGATVDLEAIEAVPAGEGL